MRKIFTLIITSIIIVMTAVLLTLCLLVIGGIWLGFDEWQDYLRKNVLAHHAFFELRLSEKWLAYSAINDAWQWVTLLVNFLYVRVHQLLLSLPLLGVLTIVAINEGVLAWMKRGFAGSQERSVIFGVAKRDITLPLIITFMAVILNPTILPAYFFVLIGGIWFALKLYISIRFYKKHV